MARGRGRDRERGRSDSCAVKMDDIVYLTYQIQFASNQNILLNSLYNANLKDISSQRYVDLGRIISPTIYVFPPLHLSYPYYLFNLLYLFILQVSFVLSKLSIHQFVRDRIEPIAVTYFGKSNNPKTYTDDPKEELPTALPTGTGTSTSTGIQNQFPFSNFLDYECLCLCLYLCLWKELSATLPLDHLCMFQDCLTFQSTSQQQALFYLVRTGVCLTCSRQRIPAV